MGKPDQIGDFLNVKNGPALRTGTGRAFHKAGPNIEKALHPVSVFIRGTTNTFEFVECRSILSISTEQVSQPDMPVGCLLEFGKLLRIF